MEGLEITVLPFSEINLGDRSDPEYYSKENLAIEHNLRNHHSLPLEKLCTVIASAFYPAATELYESGDVPFVRCVDCVSFPIISTQQDDLFERIPRWFVEESGQVQKIGKGDIVITKVGTPCYASVVHDYEEIALSRTVLGLTNIHDINPYYLTAYLRSRFGFNQLQRQRELTIQYQLTLDRVRNVLIYQASNEIQHAVEKTMLAHFDAVLQSNTKYLHAEQTLLRALGLENWQPPDPLTYQRKASEVFDSARFDAEHYRPKYDDLLNHVKMSGIELRRLDEIILPVKNGYDCRDFVDEGTSYIRVGDIKGGRINLDSAFKIPHTAGSIAKDIELQLGDILFTRKGSFGNAAPVAAEAKDAVISSEIMLLRRRKEYVASILPEYLALFFNSIAGNLQAEKWAHGVAFYSITQDDMGRFIVPLLPIREQENLKELINQSEAASKQAHELLERAKRAVEIAIEENEEAGLAYLNNPIGV